ncbi:MAG TPA: TonB-dependent receptor [Steroidobacteraceae bacterium]|nr:TonB-dependent receptor [Steroidobacteraceae bacterium]
MRHTTGGRLIEWAVSGRMLVASMGLAAALSAPLVALGQTVAVTENSGAGTSLDEIVVTANKLNAQRVLDIPASIQAISGDAIQAAGISGIMGLAGDVPGLSIQDLGPGDKKYVIRGINSTGDSTAGIYYGEAVISGSNSDDGGGFESDIRLYDIDRVEVLRGPQGTLYGASSMSGTIRFIPKSPDLNNLGGYITMEGSETSHASGNYNINGAVNLPIIDGVLALRMVGWKLYDSGYINQIRVGTGVTGISNIAAPGSPPNYQTEPVQALGFLKGVNDDDVGGGRAILRYKPTDQLTIDANYTTQTETSGGSSRYTPAGTTAFNGGPITPVQGCDLCNTDVTQSPWSDNLVVFGSTITYDTGSGTVTGTANEYNRSTGFTFDSTPILVSYDVPVPAETFEPRDRKVTSSEIRYASAFDSPVNFVAGVYREHDHQFLTVDVIATNGFGLPIGAFCSAPSCDALLYPGTGTTFFGRTDERWTTSYAGFGEATWKITDAWTAVAGIRYFTESLSGVQLQTHPFGGFAPSATLVPLPDPNETFNKVTWKGNLSYKFSESLLGYGTVSTGFRSGGVNAVSEPFEPIPKSYSPDSLINFEVGAKGRLANGLFDYQADVYFIRWSDIQVQDTTPDAAFVYQGNAGEAHVKGVEFEFTAHPIPYLTASFAGSYQDAYLVQGASAAVYAYNPTLGLTGDAIPNVPKVQLDLGLNYRAPLGNGWDGMVATDVTYRDAVNSYFASNSFNIPLAPYTLVGLRLGVIEGPWSVTAFAHNLTNKRAQVSAINSTQDPDALLTVQPRTIGLTATRKF